MSKNLEAMSRGLTEGQLAANVMESAEQIYLAGLGAVSLTQEEGSRAFSALAKEGEVVQAQVRKLAYRKMRAVAKRATASWQQFSGLVERGVKRTLDGLSVPDRSDIKRLSSKVAELTSAVEALASKQHIA